MATPGTLLAADYAVVAGFFVVMLGIGLYFSGRMRNLRDFFGGGSQVPWWVSGVSLYMTTFSAFTFVAYSALAYNRGLVAITIWWLVAICSLISAWLFAARWRRAATTSPLEYVEQRYSASLRQWLAWSGIPLIIIDDALKLFVIGKLVTVSLGVNAPHAMPTAIAVCGTIMLVYTLMGGLWAVMITDFVQFVVMMVSIIVLLPLVLSQVGGLHGFFTGLPPELWKPASGEYTWPWILSFFCIMILVYATKWPIVQRYYAVPTDREARRVGYLVAALTFFVTPMILLPALSARIFMPGIEDANEVYVLLCKRLLPIGMMGMMVASMFSATMSMLSGDYNAVAAVLTNDIYKRLIAPNASEKALVRAGRIATLLVGVVAIAVALLLTQIQKMEDLVKFMAEIFSVLVPPVGIPMTLGLLTRRVSAAGAKRGFLAGASLGLIAYILSYQQTLAQALSFDHGLTFLRSVPYLTWITAIPTIIVLLIYSRIAPDSETKTVQIEAFLAGMRSKANRTPDGADIIAARWAKAALALKVIGVSSACLGVLLALAVFFTATWIDAAFSVRIGIIMALAGWLGWLASIQIERGIQAREGLKT